MREIVTRLCIGVGRSCDCTGKSGCRVSVLYIYVQVCIYVCLLHVHARPERHYPVGMTFFKILYKWFRCGVYVHT